jgi:hypothetical protein
VWTPADVSHTWGIIAWPADWAFPAAANSTVQFHWVDGAGLEVATVCLLTEGKWLVAEDAHLGMARPASVDNVFRLTVERSQLALEMRISVISSTNDSIFGGYTPLTWSSRNASVPDPNQKTLIFTIKNPYNLPARIFKLKHVQYTSNDAVSYGPAFGGNAVYVCDKCQTCNSSYSSENSPYLNDTGIVGNQVLIGAFTVTVKEFEVFEVIQANDFRVNIAE